MGTLTFDAGDRIYLDSNCIIYYVERVLPYYDLLRPVAHAASAGQVMLYTSELSLLECLVKPVRKGDRELEQLFRTVLTRSRNLELLPISASLLEVATEIRAHNGLKTPDAIHAASALAVRCDTLLTNDNAYLNLPDLNAQLLRTLCE